MWLCSYVVLLTANVSLPRYPGRKDENWWLVVGDIKGNQLLAIKRVPLLRASVVKLDMTAPKALGVADFTLFFMCDSYMGCDQVSLVKAASLHDACSCCQNFFIFHVVAMLSCSLQPFSADLHMYQSGP